MNAVTRWYLKFGIMYATSEGTYSRDKSRAVIFTETDLEEFITYMLNNPHFYTVDSNLVEIMP